MSAANNIEGSFTVPDPDSYRRAGLPSPRRGYLI